MLHAMRHALQVQRIFDNRRLDENTCRAPALSFSARDALAWATVNNAHAMGVAERTGSVTPGKQADLILIRKDGLHTAPAGDPARAVVFYAERSDVDTVFIGGKKVKAGGELLVDSGKSRKRRSGSPNRRAGLRERLEADMDVMPDRKRRIAQGRASACILNTEARSVHRPNVGRQTQRPTLRNVHFVMFKPRWLRLRVIPCRHNNCNHTA